MIKIKHKAIFIIATLWFLLSTIFIAHKSVWLQLAVIILILPYGYCAIASLVAAFREWRKYKLRSFIPLCTCIAAFFGAFIVGSVIQAQLFEYNRARYQAIVHAIDENELYTSENVYSVDLSEDDKRLVYSALAQRTSDGSLIVELITESGFPVKHLGYVYSSSGGITKGSFIGQRWSYVREVQTNWFRVSD